jgi:hypothetical protein
MTVFENLNASKGTSASYSQFPVLSIIPSRPCHRLSPSSRTSPCFRTSHRFKNCPHSLSPRLLSPRRIIQRRPGRRPAPSRLPPHSGWLHRFRERIQRRSLVATRRRVIRACTVKITRVTRPAIELDYIATTRAQKNSRHRNTAVTASASD